jgi:hypothetical protein
VNAFAAAAAVLVADTNLGVAATWARGAATAAVRVVLSAPDVVHQVATPGVTDADAMAMLPVADLANTPAAGDTLTIGAVAWRVVSAQRDAAQVAWRLGLRGPAATTAAGTALAGAVPP